MKIHCIGVGGIGLSALARYYLSQGHIVSGSDQTPSSLLLDLEKEGIKVSTPQQASNIPEDVDLVVYTIAIPETNEELKEAKRMGVTMKTYPEALGDITKEKTTIAICGTHGKTTTTAMTYYAMRACGVNPTLIVGSLLADKGTNFMKGESDYLIVEACEYKRSFLNLHPKHIIVTNIDEDHLDYYKDINDIRTAFQSFSDKLTEGGSLTSHRGVELSTKGAHIDADQIDKEGIKLSVPGAHNRANAQLVLACLKNLGFNEEKIREGLQGFPGTWRRMEYKGITIHGVPVYDDYGHHPKELEVSVQALRERYEGKKVIMFFQPHLYSRTKALFDDFVEVLRNVDSVYVLPIYKARLEDTTVTSEEALVEAINLHGGNAHKLSFGEIQATVENVKESSSIIINMGAGNAFEEFNRLTLNK